MEVCREFARGRLRGFQAVSHAPEIFIQRVERERLQLRKGAPEFLFDPVDVVEKLAAIHLHLTAAELPVGSEEEMKTENPVLVIVQKPLTDQAKVRHVLFSFSRIDPATVAPLTEFQCHRADLRPFGDAFAETVVAGPEYCAEDAITGHFLVTADKSNAVTRAVRARVSGYPDCIRSVPMHL